MKETMMSVVVGALETIAHDLEKKLEELEIRGRIKTILTTALLNSARILRNVLETWDDLLSLSVYFYRLFLYILISFFVYHYFLSLFSAFVSFFSHPFDNLILNSLSLPPFNISIYLSISLNYKMLHHFDLLRRINDMRWRKNRMKSI